MRVPNKGMEGLTITPDGKTLVGMMQSALQTPDLTAKPAQVTTLRIVTYSLQTHATHEYIYLLTDPKINGGAVSEITALSNTKFVVDERDGNFEPNAFKQLYSIDISHATDVGPKSTVSGATYNAAKGGLLVGPQQQSIDAYVGADNTAAASSALATVGITPVTKATDVDLGALLTKLDPTGGFFGHDKVEGVATTDGGKTLVVSNDSDFGIDGIANQTAPYQLHAKMLPNGTQDDGQFLAIDTTKLNDANSTATVQIFVTPKGIHVEN
jgi:Esterase-like activity of phytase